MKGGNGEEMMEVEGRQKQGKGRRERGKKKEKEGEWKP